MEKNNEQNEENTDLFIYDVATLSDFRDRVNSGEDFEGKIIKVTKDIDFGKENTTNWVPIGNSQYGFKGTFDGQGHTISNIYINATEEFQGLFGVLDKSGIIKNITVAGGSSFISGYKGCNAIEDSDEEQIIHTGLENHYSGKIFSNISIVDGKSSMPTIDGTGTEIGHSGNGYVKITKLEE